MGIVIIIGFNVNSKGFVLVGIMFFLKSSFKLLVRGVRVFKGFMNLGLIFCCAVAEIFCFSYIVIKMLIVVIIIINNIGNGNYRVLVIFEDKFKFIRV